MIFRNFFNFLFIICLIIKFTRSYHTPVLLWGVKGPEKPALITIKQTEFTGLIKPFLNHRIIVAFLENHLAINDFQCQVPTTKETCYKYLKYVQPKTYYANVEQPIWALRSLNATIISWHNVDSSSKLNYSSICDLNEAIHFIKFNETRVDRAKLLERHDSLIGYTVRELQCAAVYLYMSSSESTTNIKRRIRRQDPLDDNKEGGDEHVLADNSAPINGNAAEDGSVKPEDASALARGPEVADNNAPIEGTVAGNDSAKSDDSSAPIGDSIPSDGSAKPDDSSSFDTSPPSDDLTPANESSSTESPDKKYFIFYQNTFAIYFSKLLLMKNFIEKQLFIVSMHVDNISDDNLLIKLASNESTELTFNVVTANDYSKISHFTYGNLKYYVYDVETPLKFSYYCGRLNAVGRKQSSLKWHNLQFQVNLVRSSNATQPINNFKFYEAWHCMGYFTPGIISGLFVTCFIISITFCGICWIMDIKTMDRFEDAKSKSMHIHND